MAIEYESKFYNPINLLLNLINVCFYLKGNKFLMSEKKVGINQVKWKTPFFVNHLTLTKV